MKKILALLCAFLLLLSTAALAEGEPVVTFRDLFQLNGTLPEGYRFSLLSQSDNTLEGEILSDDPAPGTTLTVDAENGELTVR